MSNPGEMEQLKDVDLAALTLSRGERTKTGMSFHRVFYRGEPLSLILGAVGDFPATMPFEPSVYNGDGSEARKTARLDVADSTVEAMARFEERVLELLGTNTWNYAHKKATEQYPGCIKAKIWTTGERACVVHDENGEKIKLPEQPWPKPRANAVLRVKDVYQQSRAAGLQLEVTHLQLKEEDSKMETDHTDPFEI
jgi:hypothetical protein